MENAPESAQLTVVLQKSVIRTLKQYCLDHNERLGAVVTDALIRHCAANKQVPSLPSELHPVKAPGRDLDEKIAIARERLAAAGVRTGARATMQDTIHGRETI